jgi:cell division protease FtsH
MLAVLMGGSNAIECASAMARRLVCEWGMSDLGPVTFGKKEEAIFLGREFAQHQDFSEATAVEIDREVKRILDKAYAHAKEIITAHKSSLDRIARKLLERETLEGWEVNDILREETGTDYLKMKEYYPEASAGETMTIAPGSGPSTDVSTPVAQPPAPAPVPDRTS